MNDRVARPLAWVLLALALGSSVAAIALLVLMRSGPQAAVYGFPGKTTIFAVTCGVVGVAIARRQPRNAVAWIFLASGVSAGLYELANAYAEYAILIRNGDIPGGKWAAWFGSWLWIPTTTLVPALLALFFPDGRLPSRRWRPVAWFTVLAIAFFVVTIALVPGPMPEAVYARNPVSPFPEGAYGFAEAQLWSFPTLLVALVASVAALVRRFRASRGVERLQLKWFVYAGSLTAVVLFFVPFLQLWPPYQIVNVLIINVMPIAAGVAILRYRLYDIDILIRRTIVYGATTATIGSAFFGGIVVFQALLRPVTSGSEIAVAASTLASLALFQPLRLRVQRAVDRRFYRSRYDAARTLDDFSVRLRDEVALDAVRADLLDAVRETVQPAHASVWLR